MGWVHPKVATFHKAMILERGKVPVGHVDDANVWNLFSAHILQSENNVFLAMDSLPLMKRGKDNSAAVLPS